MAFVAPGVPTSDGHGQTIPSSIVSTAVSNGASRQGLLSDEHLGGMPDELVRAMAATLNAAAAEIEVCVFVFWYGSRVCCFRWCRFLYPSASSTSSVLTGCSPGRDAKALWSCQAIWFRDGGDY